MYSIMYKICFYIIIGIVDNIMTRIQLVDTIEYIYILYTRSELNVLKYNSIKMNTLHENNSTYLLKCN